MISAHLPLPPRTCSAGRRARSTQAEIANVTCTAPSTIAPARCPVLMSFHCFFCFFCFAMTLLLCSRGYVKDATAGPPIARVGEVLCACPDPPGSAPRHQLAHVAHQSAHFAHLATGSPH